MLQSRLSHIDLAQDVKTDQEQGRSWRGQGVRLTKLLGTEIEVYLGLLKGLMKAVLSSATNVDEQLDCLWNLAGAGAGERISIAREFFPIPLSWF